MEQINNKKEWFNIRATCDIQTTSRGYTTREFYVNTEDYKEACFKVFNYKDDLIIKVINIDVNIIKISDRNAERIIFLKKNNMNQFITVIE